MYESDSSDSALSGSGGWTMPRGRPHAPWLRQVVLSEGYGHDGPGAYLGDGETASYLKDMGISGLASAWAMARRRPKEYRRKMDAPRRCSGVCPIPGLT